MNMDVHWWAPSGTPYPRDMDADGVPISVTPDGVTRWQLTSITPRIDLPPITEIEEP